MELLVLIAVVVGLFIYWKRHARPRQQQYKVGEHRSARRHASSAAQPYAAVSIAPCEDACMAAWEMQGERFLIRQAPRLPLPECDAANCGCEFVPHDDRRTPGDRRSRMSALDQEFAQKAFPERNKGRRRTDR